jgi:serine/threonine-protein kinase
MRCLEKDRARRYASADELAAALAPFEGGQPLDRASIASIAGTRVSAEASPVQASTVPPVVAPAPQVPRGEGTRVSGVSGDTAAPVSSTPPTLRSRPWKPAAAIAAVVVVAAGGVTLAVMQPKAPADRAPATASQIAEPPATVGEPPAPPSATPVVTPAVTTSAPSAEPSAGPSSSPHSTKPSVKPKPKAHPAGSHHPMD